MLKERCQTNITDYMIPLIVHKISTKGRNQSGGCQRLGMGAGIYGKWAEGTF